MRQTSLAAVLEAPGKIILREFPIPEIGPDEGLLKVEMVGICSTDVKVYHGATARHLLPVILGHEIVGRIAKVGQNAANRWRVAEGDLVVVEGAATCGACEPCYSGNYRFCLNPVGSGLRVSCTVPPHLWGAYSQYLYLSRGSIVERVNEDIGLKAAVTIGAVIANGVQWVSLLGQLKPGDTILIQGMGAQGLGAAVAAREAGAKQIIVSGLASDSTRADPARRMGADHIVNVEETDPVAVVRRLTDSRGVDVVLDVTGSPDAFAASLEAVRNQGTVVLAGATGNEMAVPVILDHIMRREIRVQGAFTSGYQAMKAGIAIAESGKYPLDDIITAEFPLTECASAMEFASGNGGARPLRVVLRP